MNKTPKYVLVKNVGEIELESFRLLGASTKRFDSNKIGFFGSGIKYALAFLLKNKIDFRVFSGEKEVVFSTEEVNLRGNFFNKILVNGLDTSITTDWGANWDAWKIFREVACNALDEDGGLITTVVELEPKEGQTHFYLDYEVLSCYFNNLDKYLLLDKINIPVDEILKKELIGEANIYKNGIRVVQERTDIKTLFDYNLSSLDINEERLAEWYEIKLKAKNLLCRTECEETVSKLLAHIISSTKDLWEIEELFSVRTSASYNFSDTWLKVLNDSPFLFAPSDAQQAIINIRGEDYIKANNIRFIPTGVFLGIQNSFGRKFKRSFDQLDYSEDFIVLDSSEEQKETIKLCLKMLSSSGIRVRYSVEVAEFFNRTVLARADKTKNRILLSDKLFDSGYMKVLRAILEEYVHLKYSVSDCTRDMQNICFEVMANLTVKNFNLKQEKPQGNIISKLVGA